MPRPVTDTPRLSAIDPQRLAAEFVAAAYYVDHADRYRAL